ncbi:MAG: MarR family winged helix-turn-helix transcriptional regulator [Sphingomonas sp.]
MHDHYDPATFRPCDSPGYLLRRVQKLSSSRVEAAFDGSDIGFTQWVALALVYHGIADTCSSLSRDLDHNSGAMTRVIDQLEERGLMVRHRDSEDRRVTKLTLTDQGRDTVSMLAGKVMATWNELLDGFEPDEVVQLISLLTRLLARLETLESDQEISA